MSMDDKPPATQGNHDDALWTLREAANFLKIGRSTVYAMAANNEIPTVRFRGCLRVNSTALREWVSRNTASLPLKEKSNDK